MGKNNNKFKISRILLIFIILLYFYFLYMDIFHSRLYYFSNIIKYIIILILLINSFLIKNYALNGSAMILLQFGLVITASADLFLLILNNNYILGVALFCIVQIIYSVRYDLKGFKKTLKLLLRIFIILSIIYWILEIDLLFMIAFYYTICLLTSTIKGLKVYICKSYPKPNRYMIAGGMIFFVLCDINVAFYNLMRQTRAIHQLKSWQYNGLFVLIWLFYIPSQIMLSFSECKFK